MIRFCAILNIVLIASFYVLGVNVESNKECFKGDVDPQVKIINLDYCYYFPWLCA